MVSSHYTVRNTGGDSHLDPYQAAWESYIRVTVRSHRKYKRSEQTRQDLNEHQKRTEKAYYQYLKTTKALDRTKMRQEANRT